jgi:hypothetical protein
MQLAVRGPSRLARASVALVTSKKEGSVKIRGALMLSAAVVSLLPASRPVPAPLLAAGIPAFLALGGVAIAGHRIRRRRNDGPSSDSAKTPE